MARVAQSIGYASAVFYDDGGSMTDLVITMPGSPGMVVINDMQSLLNLKKAVDHAVAIRESLNPIDKKD